MSRPLSPQLQRVLEFIARQPEGITDAEGQRLTGIERFGKARHELKVRGLVETSTKTKPYIWKATS